MKTLILVGSADANSHSLHLGQAIEDRLKALGTEVELINLVESGIPLYNREVERKDGFDEVTKSFLKKSQAVDAFVWVTPIYHNSFSAMLKNALDWQHSTKFPGKVVGLASNGGNRSPQAVDQLMSSARSQHMLAITTRVCTEESDYDDGLNVVNPEIIERIDKFAQELVDLTNKISSK